MDSSGKNFFSAVPTISEKQASAGCDILGVRHEGRIHQNCIKQAMTVQALEAQVPLHEAVAPFRACRRLETALGLGVSTFGTREYLAATCGNLDPNILRTGK